MDNYILLKKRKYVVLLTKSFAFFETKKSLLLNIVYEILRIHFLCHPYEMGVFSYASLTWTCAHYKEIPF